MPVIFGHEVDKRTLWIGGGLMAVAIAVVVFLRAKAGAAANEEAGAPSQPQPDQGYGMSIGAPTGAVADGYQQQIDTAEEQAKVIANKYQSNLVQQQQTQFDFEQRQREQLAPDILANERSQLAVETHYNKTKANTRVSCPKGSGERSTPMVSCIVGRKVLAFLSLPTCCERQRVSFMGVLQQRRVLAMKRHKTRRSIIQASYFRRRRTCRYRRVLRLQSRRPVVRQKQFTRLTG
jgi:hypothetical protein